MIAMKNLSLLRHSLFITLAVLMIVTSCSKKSEDTPPVPLTVKDVDGNIYKAVTLGSQVWMQENLRTTRYRNADPLSNLTADSSWSESTAGAYCDYENDTAQSAVYGRLYNWHAVNDSRKICPEGWHVPTDQEWQALVDFLGGDAVAGGKLKEAGTAHWAAPNTGATNESGFTALPGGSRLNDGMFLLNGTHAFFWSATATTGDYAWYRYIEDLDATIGRTAENVRNGLSIRCVRD